MSHVTPSQLSDSLRGKQLQALLVGTWDKDGQLEITWTTMPTETLCHLYHIFAVAVQDHVRTGLRPLSTLVLKDPAKILNLVPNGKDDESKT